MSNKLNRNSKKLALEVPIETTNKLKTENNMRMPR